MELIDSFFAEFVNYAWGWQTALLLLGAGVYFSIKTELKPFRYLGYAFEVLQGKHPSKDEVGEVSHFRALTASLSGTIGLGNIAGVAVAIQLGGPGAIFWMWVTAVFGIATKFFTATLSVLYREQGPDGKPNAGTMYIIKNGLPKYMLPLAYFFAFFGIIAGLPAFQANQVVQLTNDLYFPEVENFAYYAGAFLVIITAAVVLGGLKRIANVSALLVPLMGGLYLIAVLVAVMLNYQMFFPALSLIVSEAFSFDSAVAGGLVGVILTGIKRGAFSNEAGIGTEALIHGAAKTSHPVKQGLIAMTGPIFDTLIMCTLTAVIILISGVYQTSDSSGVTLTSEAFLATLGPIGPIILFVCVISFGLSTIFTYSYYGSACSKFLFGEKSVKIYQYIFIVFVFIFSITSLDLALNVIDSAFAMMAIPTLIASIWLAPKVIEQSDKYFSSIKKQ